MNAKVTKHGRQTRCALWPHVIAMLAVGLVGALGMDKSWGQMSSDDFSASDFIGQQLSEAYSAYQDARGHCAALQVEFAQARAKYRIDLATGRDLKEASDDLVKFLDQRDYLMLTTDMIGGRNTPQARLIRSLCNVDGDMNTALAPFYRGLLQALRRSMGARSDDDFISVAFLQFQGALAANPVRTESYVRIRNYIEFLGSGVPTERVVDAATFAKLLLEYDVLVGARVDQIPADIDSIGATIYAQLVDELGQDTVLHAAQTVLTLPKTDHALLAERFNAPSPPTDGSGTLDPATAFWFLLKASPRAYVMIEQGFSRGSNYASRFQDGADYYNDLVETYGEAQVESAAEKVWNAAKVGSEILVRDGDSFKLQSLTGSFEQLLRDPDFELPSDIEQFFLAASDTEGIADAEGTFQLVFGRVNDVLWADGGRETNKGDYDYLYAYFSGAKDFAAMTYYPAYWPQHAGLGPNAQGLIGKLFRIQGRVEKRHPNNTNPIAPNWRIRALEHNDFSVINEEQWPGSLPIPIMQAARTIEQLKADQIPLEALLPQDTVARRGRQGATPIKILCGVSSSLEVASKFQPTADPSMNHYLRMLADWSIPIGQYQAISEICAGKPVPAIRDNFVTAAMGQMDAARGPQLRGHVEVAYQSACLSWSARGCDKDLREYTEVKYNGVMRTLTAMKKSGYSGVFPSANTAAGAAHALYDPRRKQSNPPATAEPQAGSLAADDDPTPDELPSTNQEAAPDELVSAGDLTLKTSAESVRAGDPITIEISGLPGNQRDWFTLVKADAAADIWGAFWTYTDGKPMGNWTVDAPAPGEYEVRVYFDYPNGGWTIHARKRIRVTAE